MIKKMKPEYVNFLSVFFKKNTEELRENFELYEKIKAHHGYTSRDPLTEISGIMSSGLTEAFKANGRSGPLPNARIARALLILAEDIYDNGKGKDLLTPSQRKQMNLFYEEGMDLNKALIDAPASKGKSSNPRLKKENKPLSAIDVSETAEEAAQTQSVADQLIGAARKMSTEPKVQALIDSYLILREEELEASES